MVNWNIAADRDELAQTLATIVAADLANALSEREQATLAVSGGSTPKPFFEALSQVDLDWSRILITLVDERWVDDTHADSNARLVHNHLLTGRAAGAQFIGLKTPGADVFAAETQSAEQLQAFEQADVIVLGMGTDGHTASFFPGASTLDAALDPESNLRCIGVRPPAAPHDRMTLTLSLLLRAKKLYLHVTGIEKRKLLDEVEAGHGSSYPVAAVCQGRPDLQVHYAP